MDLSTNRRVARITPIFERLFAEVNTEGNFDIGVLTLEPDPQTWHYIKTEFNEGAARLSPDGQWMAYTSDESGDFHVYVSSFPEPTRRWQISDDPGSYVFWRADGGEIIYTETDGDRVSVELDTTGETLQIGESRTLFNMASPTLNGAFFSISSDAEKILVIPSVAQQADSMINLVVNWPTELERRR